MYANLKVLVGSPVGPQRVIYACRVLVDASGVEVTEDLNAGTRDPEPGQVEVFPLGTELEIAADF